jgi:hypothetical protein
VRSREDNSRICWYVRPQGAVSKREEAMAF